MSNVPAIQFANTVPQLSAEVAASFGAMFDETFNDLGAGSNRRLRPRKMDFLIVDGGNQEIVPNDRMFAVLLGSAPCNHAVWYERSYAPGQEPAAPDLVWKMPTPNTFPDALPVQFREKIDRDGRKVWAFQQLRRTVWALARFNADGTMALELDRPFVFDISSMSLYGKSMPEQNMYKWAGIRDVCSKYSGNGSVVFPSMFVTQIVLDTTVTVSGPVMFRPMRDQNGNLQYLDTNTINTIHSMAVSKQIKDMVEVREKLSYGDNAPVTQAATAIDLQQPAPVAQPVAPQSVYQPAPAAQPVAQPAQTWNTQPTAVNFPEQTIVNAPTASDPNQLLANAQAMLDQQNQPQVAPSPAVTPAAPVAAPMPNPQPANAATVTSTIEGLLNALG